MGLFGVGSSSIIDTTKKVISAILKWIWDKIKDYVKRHWQYVVMAFMGLIIFALGKLLLLKLSITPVLRNLGLLESLSCEDGKVK